MSRYAKIYVNNFESNQINVIYNRYFINPSKQINVIYDRYFSNPSKQIFLKCYLWYIIYDRCRINIP